MRTVAAIPALGLLAGSLVGFLVPDIIQPLASTLLICGAAAALWAWWISSARAVAMTVAAAFAAGGALLAADAWQRAWRPTLRIAFEELARAERAQAALERRVRPEDDEAFATVTGVLRADAARTLSGVSLSIDVDGIGAAAAMPSRGQANPRRGISESLRWGRAPTRGSRAWGPGWGPSATEKTAQGGLLVTVVGSLAPSSIDEWRAGRRVRMPVQLHRPARYLDPGVSDSERRLARSGTTLVGTVKSGALVETIGYGRWWSEGAGAVRLFARRAIARAVGRWSPQSAAIVTAIVIGDRAGLDDDVRRRLQEAGTYHVIAISGGNIAILAGLLVGAFRWAGCLGRGAMLAAIGVLVAYAGLVGGGASVERATLMAVVYFAARAFDQRSPPLNALWVVAALLVATDPLAIADPAFGLTFGATLGILIVAPIVRQRSPQSTRRKHISAISAGSAVYVVSSVFAASLAAETLLFPVGALVFSRVTFAGLGLNFLAIPLMALAQLAGMAIVPAALVSTRLATAAGWIAHVGAGGLVWSADLVRFAPVLTYRVAPPAWDAVVVYYASLVACWALWPRRSEGSGSPPSLREFTELRRGRLDPERRFIGYIRRTAMATAIVGAAWILAEPWTLRAARGDGLLHVTFLDVGQGDSVLLRFPRGSTMLVDAGGLVGSPGFDIGDRVVAPVLRDGGIRRLDYVVLTHGDPDHIGGAAAIVREFRPREVWEGIPVPRFEPLTALGVEARAAGAHWRNVYRGDRLSVDGVDVEAAHPGPGDWERQKVRNDDSLVLDVRWREVSVLLTGDVGREVERTLGEAAAPAPRRVLKVPHHGSLTSSSPEFLQAIQPQIAVFSVGRANHFGHPAPQVLQRYQDIGAAIFRTDQDGAITIDTDGHAIDVRTFAGRTLHLKEMQPRKHEDTKDSYAPSTVTPPN
jgi:competence protein ComEC